MKRNLILFLGFLMVCLELHSQINIATGLGINLNKLEAIDRFNRFNPKEGYGNFDLGAVCMVEQQLSKHFTGSLNFEFTQHIFDYRLVQRNSVIDKLKFQIFTIGGNINWKIFHKIIDENQKIESFKWGLGFQVNDFRKFKLRRDMVWREDNIQYEGQELLWNTNITYDNGNFRLVIGQAKGIKQRKSISNLMDKSGRYYIQFFYLFHL